MPNRHTKDPLQKAILELAKYWQCKEIERFLTMMHKIRSTRRLNK